MTEKRPDVDWEAIEREFRAGQLSVREISRQHNISHVAVTKRAKAAGWKRNLAARVREEVTNRLVTSEVNTADAEEAVNVAAARGVEVVRQHRSDIGKFRELGVRLHDELDATTTHAGELAAMIEEATADDKTPQRRNTMMRAIELPGRIGSYKDLSMAMKNLLPLERQAFNLDDSAGVVKSSLADLIAESMAARGLS